VDDFGQKIEAEIPRLRRFALALTRNVVAADDLVQDCLIRGLAERHQQQENLRARLFSALNNQYLKRVRRAASVGKSALSSTCVAAQGKPLELRDLDRALAQLPEEQRIVILMVGLEGMSYEAVAEVIGVPIGTVRSRLSRGREDLRRLMGIRKDPKAEATTRSVRVGKIAA
jgi:RNA polymerase sigma-70 factor, ECF subfamily